MTREGLREDRSRIFPFVCSSLSLFLSVFNLKSITNPSNKLQHGIKSGLILWVHSVSIDSVVFCGTTSCNLLGHRSSARRRLRQLIHPPVVAPYRGSLSSARRRAASHAPTIFYLGPLQIHLVLAVLHCTARHLSSHCGSARLPAAHAALVLCGFPLGYWIYSLHLFVWVHPRANQLGAACI